MSKYTTEIRFICEHYNLLNVSADYPTINEIIQKAIPKIFDFDFPIFDEKYRNVLETKILKHFYTREIGEETVALWKFRLDTKLNEIMPYYNKLYETELLDINPLYNHNMKTTSNRKKDDTTNNTGVVINKGKNNSDKKGATTTNNSSYELYSDTPQGNLTGIENSTYLTNATKNNEENSTKVNENNSSTTENTVDTTEKTLFYGLDDYVENVVGYTGTSASDLILKFRETFLNIDMQIINELECLFMGLW